MLYRVSAYLFFDLDRREWLRLLRDIRLLALLPLDPPERCPPIRVRDRKLRASMSNRELLAPPRRCIAGVGCMTSVRLPSASTTSPIPLEATEAALPVPLARPDRLRPLNPCTRERLESASIGRTPSWSGELSALSSRPTVDRLGRLIPSFMAAGTPELRDLPLDCSETAG